MEFRFGQGYDQAQSLLYGLEALGFAEKRGTLYTIYNLGTGGKEKGAGKSDNQFTLADFRKLIVKNPWLYNKLMRSINVS